MFTSPRSRLALPDQSGSTSASSHCQPFRAAYVGILANLVAISFLPSFGGTSNSYLASQDGMGLRSPAVEPNGPALRQSAGLSPFTPILMMLYVDVVDLKALCAEHFCLYAIRSSGFVQMAASIGLAPGSGGGGMGAGVACGAGADPKPA